MIGVPVAERSPSTRRTLDASLCGRAPAAAVAADASAPGSITPADRNESFSSRTRPLGCFTGTFVWCGARRCVVVDVSGSSRMRRSW
jgi:hypothetical protein